jgi:hypothetical protein
MRIILKKYKLYYKNTIIKIQWYFCINYKLLLYFFTQFIHAHRRSHANASAPTNHETSETSTTNLNN